MMIFNHNHLSIQAIEDINCLSSFHSGIQSMDDFIHGPIKESMKNHFCQAYVAVQEGTVVAMFALSFDSLDLDSDDKDELMSGISMTDIPQINFDYRETFLAKSRYPALDVAYFAVDEGFQHQEIGHFLMD